MSTALEQLQDLLPGKVFLDDVTREKYKRDASVFEIKPQAIVVPESVEDIKKLVEFVNKHKHTTPHLSLSARAAGTCMSGGSLTDSIMIVFSKLNHLKHVAEDHAIVEPGMFYRDFEKEILKHGLVYPPYPSSRLLCAVGGIAANNAGGEKSLHFGKAEDFVNELKVILRDGNEYEIKKLSLPQLEKKVEEKTFESEIYRKVFRLVHTNYDLIQKHRPEVSKNSAGYDLWRVWDKEHFDLTKLFVGSQGTLGIITEINFRLVPKKKHRGLLVVYMENFDHLPEIVQTVMKHDPDSFETFDHYTLRLALKYVTGFAPVLKTNVFKTVKQFLPEYAYVIAQGMPKLMLLIEFEDDSFHVIHGKLKLLEQELHPYKNLRFKMTHNEAERRKYWAIRRESFNLLRKRVKGKYAAPFIDDTCVNPKVFPEFLPKLYEILDGSGLQYTIAGHIGNGNFHIIPLMDLTNEHEREKIHTVSKKVFDLVLQFGGSTSGEHNDGLVRSPFLKQQFGDEMYGLFKEIKHIFDPDNIFNPHKKVDVTEEFTKKFIIGTPSTSMGMKDY